MHNSNDINIYFTRELQGEIKGLVEEVDFEKNRLEDLTCAPVSIVFLSSSYPVAQPSSPSGQT